MSVEENKAIVRRYFEELWNNGDLAFIEECMGPDILHTWGHETHESWRVAVSAWLTAFPDFQYHVDELVAEGDTVKLKSVGRPARIMRRIDDNHFEVEIGAMKMKIARDDIAEVVVRAGDSPVTAARARGFSVSLEKESANAASEINVIGRTVDDATGEVEKFIDRAFLAGLPRVRVVHGSGMGILRKALRQYLQQHPHVASVTEPPQNEGGAGATVVELRV